MNTTNQPDRKDANHATPARRRLILAARDVFSKKGFGGASIREICLKAGTSSNMVHHYFGSKQGLYDEILAGFTDDVWTVPARIISKTPKNREQVISILEIFIEETLEALILHRETFELVVREKMVFKAFAEYSENFVAFLEASKRAGLLRQDLDTTMLTGAILDRLGNQILYASWIDETTGQNVLSDKGYRTRWLRANLDLFLHGTLA